MADAFLDDEAAMRAPGDPATNDADTLEEAREAYKLAVDTWSENFENAKDDLRFARLSEQWDRADIQRRKDEGRPCLTINKLPSFIRQVANDARLNKPSIKFHPVDSKADVETAKIYDGLVRTIEYASNADVAYDTAIESAIGSGFGYFRVGIDYAHDDTFDLDITIDAVPDPFRILGDPYSTAADSSDWNSAFVTDVVPENQFEADYPGADKVNWDEYQDLPTPWYEDKTVLKVEWWTRSEITRPIVRLSNGDIVDAAWLAAVDPDSGARRVDVFASVGITVVAERDTKSWKVKQRILTGAEVLDTVEWPGKYIPIIPVYGDEVNIDGKRHFRSLIRDAKDPQRMFNAWRTIATELVALAPRVPFIGPTGAFKTDALKWSTINRVSHSHVGYDGNVAPQRQPLDSGPAAGALQEALNASDDMKAIIGLYDASLGARSNETSGKAIIARQREGDVSTFHFQDNLARAIRHGGRVIGDLIPHVYSAARVVRVLGEDGSERPVQINQEFQATDDNGQPMVDEAGQAITRIYNLSVGKYDLTVSSGPSFTTRREEAATQMMEFIRLYPAAAPLIGHLVAKNLDWPGADEIAEVLQKMLPQQLQDESAIPPEVQQFIEEAKAEIERLTKENEALKTDQSIKAGKLAIDDKNAETKQFDAETDRLAMQAKVLSPEQIIELINEAVAAALGVTRTAA